MVRIIKFLVYSKLEFSLSFFLYISRGRHQQLYYLLTFDFAMIFTTTLHWIHLAAVVVGIKKILKSAAAQIFSYHYTVYNNIFYFP